MGCYMLYGVWCMGYLPYGNSSMSGNVFSAIPWPVRPMTNSLTLRIRNMAMA